MQDRVVFLELNIENLGKLAKGVSNIFSDNLSVALVDKNFYKSIGINNGIVYNYDSVQYGQIENLVLNFDNIIEARFFNDEKEIDIRLEEGIIRGAIVIDNGNKDFIIENTLYLKKNKIKEYDKLKVKKYVDFDEDGQAFVFYIKPCAFVKEER